MTYNILKKIIKNGNYDKDDILNKMDVFLMGNRITTEQYNELKEMIDDEHND